MEAPLQCVGVYPPQPNGARAKRVKWCMKPSADGSERVLVYGAGQNLVFRDLNNPSNTRIFNEGVLNAVTAVAYSPNGYSVAFGDDKGGVRVGGYNADGAFIANFSETLLAGPVNDLKFSDDSKKLIAVGGGGQRAKTVNLETKGKWGDIAAGHNATLLTCDMKYSKPQAILAAGEDLEVHTYKAMPPGYVGSQKFGPGFINQVAFTPWDEGAHYVTISSDKSIKLINTESKECLVDKQACHKMGISELAFAAEAGVFYTASNDRTIKKWKIDFEAKSIEELSVLTLSAVDEQQYKENVDK